MVTQETLLHAHIMQQAKLRGYARGVGSIDRPPGKKQSKQQKWQRPCEPRLTTTGSYKDHSTARMHCSGQGRCTLH
jgi:hypothetical protein